MSSPVKHAVPILLIWIFITGIVYPLLITGIAQWLFPNEANGSLIVRAGKPVGSMFIGQSFDDPRYFLGRLSATSPMPYNAAASGGSNLGPTSPALIGAVTARIKVLEVADPGNQSPIPVDLVTASGSGLDPHISPAAAEFQVKRVAKARNLTTEAVRALVARYTESPQFNLLGESRVNVLRLNLALDEIGQPAPDEPAPLNPR